MSRGPVIAFSFHLSTSLECAAECMFLRSLPFVSFLDPRYMRVELSFDFYQVYIVAYAVSGMTPFLLASPYFRSTLRIRAKYSRRDEASCFFLVNLKKRHMDDGAYGTSAKGKQPLP
jgi:hypothetical protein